MSSPYLKDPGDRLDYQVDYADWLGADEISVSAWTVPVGLTNYASSADDTTATVWLAGGTHGQDYTVTNQITTAGGRVKQQSFVVMVRNDVA